MKSFKEIEKSLKLKKNKRLVIAAANEKEILEAAKKARDNNIADLILVGDKEIISRYFNEQEAEIIDEKDPERATVTAVEMLVNDQADAIMKGLVHSDFYLKTILNKKEELIGSRFLSHVALAEINGKFLIISDVGMNIDPDVKQKTEIIKNIVGVSHKLGFKRPKVALICPTEQVNLKISGTVEAAIISKMAERGQLDIEADIDGPMALDVAISMEAAETKKVHSFNNVPGNADIIVLDGLTDGNVFYKTLEIFLNIPKAAVIVGAKKPIVLTSRSDKGNTKYNSLLLALAISGDDEQ
jgi:phosphate butyryltransferase